MDWYKSFIGSLPMTKSKQVKCLEVSKYESYDTAELFSQYLDRALDGGRSVLLDNLADKGKEFKISSDGGDFTKFEIADMLEKHFKAAMEAGKYERSARILKTFKKNDIGIPDEVRQAIQQCSDPKAKAKLNSIYEDKSIVPSDKQAAKIQDWLQRNSRDSIEKSAPPGKGTRVITKNTEIGRQ